jgi:RNA 3'-terminal phosphate cyclase (ATP)
VRLVNIRAKRPRPGLQPQHLMAVKAAATICGAEVAGAALHSQYLTFHPGTVLPDDYRFDIGTAGATSLVAQTVFVPLALAKHANPFNQSDQRPIQPASELTIIGGTHVPHSPSYHYLSLNWLPMLDRLGYDADLDMLLAGFYPQGGGEVRMAIRPVDQIEPLDLPERGALKRITGISAVANLDMGIAERQRKQAYDRMKSKHGKIDIEVVNLPARTKGTMLLLLAEFRHTTACYFSLGAPGKRAEQVADEACLWMERFLAGNGTVDEYLADQLLLPLAFAAGESRFRTAQVTEHLRTNAAVVEAFGAAEVDVEKDGGREGTVRVRPQTVIDMADAADAAAARNDPSDVITLDDYLKQRESKNDRANTDPTALND